LILFQAVGDYWLGNVSERLQDLVKKDEFIFINCKHRFLRMQVCQLQYTCGDKLPDGVKIINNLGDSKWGYLWERFWTHTSSIQKIVIVTVLMFNLYLLFFFLKIKLTKKQS
jgi:hypothetical protein